MGRVRQLSLGLQCRSSRIRRDARRARDIGATPNGLDFPRFSLSLETFYLQLPRFRGYELLQGIDEVPSYETPTVRRFGSRRSTIESLQKDIYLVIGASGFGSRHIVEHLARADAISVLDVVQRHRDVSFYIGDTTGRRDVLDVLKKSGATCIVRAALLQHSAKDPSVCYKVNVEGTRTIIVAAIAAGVLYQHSRTRIQIGDNNDMFDYTYIGNITSARL